MSEKNFYDLGDGISFGLTQCWRQENYYGKAILQPCFEDYMQYEISFNLEQEILAIYV